MLIIGSRGSQLALAQSSWVRQEISRRFPEETIEVKVIRTSADRDQSASIRSGSATGVFVKEIEEALIAGTIDLAVHSMKDLPTRIPGTLRVEAIPAREDPRDALIACSPLHTLDDLPRKAVIGTGSVRRQAQLLALRPDLIVRDIRGNVDTRIGKLQSGDYDAIVLACAGLNRLGLEDRISLRLDISSMLPAPGQGALALEIRSANDDIARFIAALNHRETAISVRAEREFLRAMGGGCNSPIAVHAWFSEGTLRMEGLVAVPDGSRVVRESVCVAPEDTEPAAAALAEVVLSKGGREILETCH